MENESPETTFVGIDGGRLRIGMNHVLPDSGRYELPPGASGWIGIVDLGIDEPVSMLVTDDNCRLIAEYVLSTGLYELILDATPELLPTDREPTVVMFPGAGPCPQPGAAA